MKKYEDITLEEIEKAIREYEKSKPEKRHIKMWLTDAAYKEVLKGMEEAFKKSLKNKTWLDKQ